jgi:polygalacturonase
MKFALLTTLFAWCEAGAVCDVTSARFGGKCDNVTDDAPAIQRALFDPSCTTVLISARLPCVSRALNLSLMSGRTLLVETDLAIWRDPKTYSLTLHNNPFLSAPSSDGSWTGPLVEGFTLGGGGRILGGGAAWWPFGKSLTRPRTLWLPNASALVIANLTLVDSPAWNVGVRGEDVLISNMRIESGMGSCGGYGAAPNTDGFNLGGHRLVVKDSFVHNGDDCIPVTTGNDGSTSNVHAVNIHCECGTNGGVIYNQGGMISGVLFEQLTVRSTNQGAGIKLSEPGRDASGGLVTNITWRDVAIDLPRYAAIYTNVFGEDAQSCKLPSNPALKNWLTVSGVVLQNVTATVPSGQAAGCFLFTPGRTGKDYAFNGVVVREQGGAAARAYSCFNTEGFTAAGSTSPPPC